MSFGRKFTLEDAKEFLLNSGLFYYEKGDEEYIKENPGYMSPEEIEENKSLLNLNDVFGWAWADCEKVSDEEFPKLAELVWLYGFSGAIYWASKKRNGLKSEFHHYNRFIEFVEKEEKIANKFDSHSKYAYSRQKYKIGCDNTP